MERLVHLRDYWANRLLKNDSVRLHTSQKPGFACGIANAQESAKDNTLSSGEKKDGFVLLFNGNDLSGWKNNRHWMAMALS